MTLRFDLLRLGLAGLACCALAACAEKDDDDDTEPDGPEDTSEYGGCEEVSRTAVAGPSYAADGFDFAAGDLLAAAMGGWSGEGELGMGEEGEGGGGEGFGAWADFRLDDEVFAVTMAPRDSSGGGEEPLIYEECASYYETNLELTFHADGGLVALDDVATTLSIWAVDDGGFRLTLDADEFDMALIPDDIDLSEWDEYDLRLVGTAGLEGWAGSVEFMASRVDGEVAEAMGTTVMVWRMDMPAVE